MRHDESLVCEKRLVWMSWYEVKLEFLMNLLTQKTFWNAISQLIHFICTFCRNFFVIIFIKIVLYDNMIRKVSKILVNSAI